MLVFLGNPADRPLGPYSQVYYLMIGGMIAHSLVFFCADLKFLNKDRIHATFLKVLLLSEQRRETRRFKLIFIILQVFYVGFIAYVSLWDLPKFYKECQAFNNSKLDCNEFKPPMDSPRPSSINFWILLVTWVLACYNVLNYNDCYNGLMLPKIEFMAKHFPDELKMAKERFPKALADKKDVGRAEAFCSKFLGGNEKVTDLLFEPNIPIRPIYSCCTWFLTDTSETLRNIMLVCGRVDVLWQKHQSQLVSSMKISEFLRSTHTTIDEKLTDDSLKWEYVLACRLQLQFRIILMLSAGTFKT
jgi:hypothetical protein